MAEEHFSYEVIERFIKAELSRGENREVVRHLLRRCPRCCRLVREVAHGRNLHWPVHGLETSVPCSDRSDASSPQQILDRILRLVGRRTARAGLR
jgi:hypothetical protein